MNRVGSATEEVNPVGFAVEPLSVEHDQPVNCFPEGFFLGPCGNLYPLTGDVPKEEPTIRPQEQGV